MPKRESKNEQNDEHGGRRAGMVTGSIKLRIFSVHEGVPDVTQTDCNHEDGPVAPNDGPGVQVRMQVNDEKENADGDDDECATDGTAPFRAVVGHAGIPSP